ncbi:MAG TPA: hypothetical protein PK198_14965 [Saprospiraceae bacterium]|jgi:hypothetical protein|nr:hypothetical protein [Saprospiraceae bacterium]HRF40090.1 hypothetical protein [Saprospiraceae bacterium]HRK79799.1 hypothetical protein [Saprospiraceae bacterium]
MEQLNEIWAWLAGKTAAFGPLEWGLTATGGMGLLVLPFLIGMSRRQRKVVSRVPTHLAFYSYQSAPLGRDALLKIKNTRDHVVLLSVAIKGSDEIEVKNASAGHELLSGKVYGIMLEAAGKDRMLPDFELVLTYMDAGRNVWKQSFFPDLQGAGRAKRIKKA